MSDANVRVTNRPAEQPLGANSRDEGHSVSVFINLHQVVSSLFYERLSWLGYIFGSFSLAH